MAETLGWPRRLAAPCSPGTWTDLSRSPGAARNNSLLCSVGRAVGGIGATRAGRNVAFGLALSKVGGG